jgi:hypothetical protein
MLYDAEARRQLCRERADELAREVRLARRPAAQVERRARLARSGALGLAALLGSVRRQARERALAHRA